MIKKTLNNSKSSNHLISIPENSNAEESFDSQTPKKININIKESRNLLNEYKENLAKFDNNINEIKNALNMLKISLGNYKVKKTNIFEFA